MKKSIIAYTVVFLCSHIAFGSIGNIEFDIGNPAMQLLGRTTGKFNWVAGHFFATNQLSMGLEYSRHESGPDGGTYSGTTFPVRDALYITDQYGLRIGAYWHGVNLDSFYGVISTGISQRSIQDSVDQKEIQYSGYGSMELGYQFVFAKMLLLKTAIVSSTDNYTKDIAFSGLGYTETMKAPSVSGLRISLGAAF